MKAQFAKNGPEVSFVISKSENIGDKEVMRMFMAYNKPSKKPNFKNEDKAFEGELLKNMNFNVKYNITNNRYFVLIVKGKNYSEFVNL